MNPVTTVKLCVMMFLQYFVWGIWLPILPLKLGTLGLNPNQISMVMACYGFGSILGPFVIGQIADRYIAAQRVLSGVHIIGGLMLIYASTLTSYWPIFLTLFLYCNLYMPTMGLSNAIAFKGLGEENAKYFAWVRNLGTIGWVAAGFFFTWYLYSFKPEGVLECFKLSGYFSIAYGVFCWFLPHTPPSPAKATDPADKKSTFLESLELMKNPSFAVLVFTAGVIGIMLAFYFGCEGTFLTDAVGIKEEEVGSYMAIGQIAEMLVMFLVPFAVTKLGVKNTMVLGALFWAARFGLSILGQPQWLMISTIAFHGFCFGFFFVVAFMFVDKAASADIKSTAQNLLVFVVYGLGTVVGNLLVGPLRTAFGNNWAAIWAGPFVLTLLAIAAFALLFNPKGIGEATDLGKPSVH